MAGEGLFFTGTVFKNNRDLLKEEAARQQLELQKEQLELQKQAAADRRKEARKKNEYKPKDYSTDEMDPFFVDKTVNEASEYQNFVRANSQDVENNPELMSEISNREGNIVKNSSLYRSLSSDISSYDALARGGNKDTLATAEDGRYVYQYNFDKIKELTSGPEAISVNEALEMYPLDPSVALKQTPFKNPEDAKYDAKEMDTIKNPDGSSYKTLGDLSGVTNEVISMYTPDSNGSWDNDDAKKVYLGQEGGYIINGEKLKAYEAFAQEEKKNSNASETFLKKLDPNSGTYEPELAKEYVQYIARKAEEKAKKNNPNQIISYAQEDKDEKKQEEAIKKLRDKYFIPSKYQFTVGNIKLKGDVGMYDASTESTAGEVSIGLQDLLDKEGPLYEAFEKEFNSLASSGSTSLPASVKGVYLTTDNVAVAQVKLNDGAKSVLVPLANISNFAEKLKGRAKEIYLTSQIPSSSSKGSAGDAIFGN